MKLALTITAALLVCSAVASAQEPAEPTPVDAENDPVELAVDRCRLNDGAAGACSSESDMCANLPRSKTPPAIWFNVTWKW